jgi:hypothetical protein
VLYPKKLPFKNEGEIQTFPDTEKLNKFVTRHALQQMLNKSPVGLK